MKSSALMTITPPAKNDREKYRIAGIERSRNAWSSQQARLDHTSHRPCTSVFDLPAVLTSLLPCARRRTCGRSPHILLTLLQQGASVNDDVSQVMQSLTCDHFANFTVRRFALVKAQGFSILPARVMRQMPNLDLPAVLVSLDNSCPPTSG